MDRNVFPIRLREARLMMKLSMDQLAGRTGGIITKQSISRYEKGNMLPKHEAFQALVSALDISESYFSSSPMQLDVPMLRSTSGDMLSAEQLQALEARLSFWAEQYLAKENAVGLPARFVHPIPQTITTSLEDAILAGERIRSIWNCGNGPIASVLRLFERKGIKILLTELPDKVYGLSTWADKQHPLMALDARPAKTTTERLRFTAVHELAHLLLSFPEDFEQSQAEQLCNKFASFFLFPKETFIEEMGSSQRTRLILEEMIDLKKLYGVSVAAQVHEAWDLQMISREHYDWWFDECISKNRMEKGWGEYKFPETIGREMRIGMRMTDINQHNHHETIE